MYQNEFQSPKALARFILREALFGSLATEGEGGYPFVSLVGIAALTDGAPLMLVAQSARHSVNLRKDPRVSLLLIEKPASAVPMQAARLTVTGKAAPVGKAEVRARYLVRHPEASGEVDLEDHGFWRIEIERGHLIGLHGRESDLTPADLVG